MRDARAVSRWRPVRMMIQHAHGTVQAAESNPSATGAPQPFSSGIAVRFAWLLGNQAVPVNFLTLCAATLPVGLARLGLPL